MPLLICDHITKWSLAPEPTKQKDGESIRQWGPRSCHPRCKFEFKNLQGHMTCRIKKAATSGFDERRTLLYTADHPRKCVSESFLYSNILFQSIALWQNIVDIWWQRTGYCNEGLSLVVRPPRRNETHSTSCWRHLDTSGYKRAFISTRNFAESRPARGDTSGALPSPRTIHTKGYQQAGRRRRNIRH